MPGKKVKGEQEKGPAGKVWKAAAETAQTGPLTFHLSLLGYW